MQKVIKKGGQFVHRGDPAAFDRQIGDFTCDNTWREWDLSAIIPQGTKAVLFRIRIKDGITGLTAGFRRKSQGNDFVKVEFYTQVANIHFGTDIIVVPDTDRIIEYRIEVGMDVIDVVVNGWWV